MAGGIPFPPPDPDNAIAPITQGLEDPWVAVAAVFDVNIPYSAASYPCPPTVLSFVSVNPVPAEFGFPSPSMLATTAAGPVIVNAPVDNAVPGPPDPVTPVAEH